MAASRGGDATRRPSRWMLPAVGDANPQSSRSSVVFPPPDGPTIARNSPDVTSNATPASAAGPVSEYRFARPETRRTSSLTDCSVMPGENAALRKQEEPVEHVAQ